MMSAFGSSKIFDYNSNTKSTKTSSISSSSSSSTTDFEDLLPDLWQTASEDDSDMKYSHFKMFDTPHHHLFQQHQQPSQQQVQQLPAQPQPLAQGQQHNWFSASPIISVSPPLRSSSTLWEEHPVVLEQPANTTSNTTTVQQPMFYLPQDDELFNFDQVKHPHHHNHHHEDQIQPQPQAANHKTPINTQLYKTELCASFMKMGVCPYGNKCQFAHGENELKHVDRPPKWRSKPCANWSKYGSCRYGNRCCFKHGD
ncbi:mRNA decay factor CTH1 [Candida viswanathii]|uniref:mRNA decay factor CTH1 n=1 Tax=Candida viswanathii TaxID=5486 RepID=A0A367XPZ0_9ASCO|nr:mRNA decay factor CTH1 [Candida viswanathii]